MSWGNVKEAADACGLPVESWRRWERDNRAPRSIVEVAGIIADRTGCDYGWLLAGSRLRSNGSGTDRYPITGVIGPISRKRPTNPRPPGHPGGIRHPDGFVRPARTSKPIAA